MPADLIVIGSRRDASKRDTNLSQAPREMCHKVLRLALSGKQATRRATLGATVPIITVRKGVTTALLYLRAIM